MSLKDTKDEAEREAILSALRAYDGNTERAANALGISDRTLFRRLKRHGLNGDARAIREAAGQPGTGRPRTADGKP